MDILAGTLLAASICTADGWQPWVVVTVYGMVCSSLHSSLQSVEFGPLLPFLVLLLFSLSWVICPSGRSQVGGVKGLGAVYGALGHCHGVGMLPGELSVGALSVPLTGTVGGR